MKTCYECGESKELKEFSLRKMNKSDGRQSRCKACTKADDRRRYQANKEKRLLQNGQLRERNRKHIRGYLMTHPCLDCGEGDPVVLEFDHVTGVKVDHVTRLGHKAVSIEKIDKEIKKCEVRCGNCHRRRHFSGSREA